MWVVALVIIITILVLWEPPQRPAHVPMVVDEDGHLCALVEGVPTRIRIDDSPLQIPNTTDAGMHTQKNVLFGSAVHRTAVQFVSPNTTSTWGVLRAPTTYVVMNLSTAQLTLTNKKPDTGTWTAVPVSSLRLLTGSPTPN